MTTRITMMLLLAVACAVNAGCACMKGCTSCGSGAYSGSECASCGAPEASCCCPDDYSDCASCGLPDASCGCPEASCNIPDASCGLPAGGCDTVGCGSPVVGRCRLMQRICDAFRGQSSCASGGCSSETYWSEWQNDPPSNCQTCSQGSGLGRSGYSSAQRRRSQLAKRNINFGDELRFAERTSDSSRR